MRDNDLYERFECIHPPRHRKYYELEVELGALLPQRLVRRWGKIGTRRPRELRGRCATPDELMTVVTLIRSRRVRHGYHRISALSPSHSAQAALTPQTDQVA